MNTESRYVFDDEPSDNEGLGRLPTQLPSVHRSVPGHEKILRKKRSIRSRKRPKTAQPRQKPRPRPIPRPLPVIDKNPAAPPMRFILKTRKPTSKKKTRSRANVQKKRKPAVNKPAVKSGGMLDGTVKVGGLEIKKKHAAAAGGATAGGLLLWRLLF